MRAGKSKFGRRIFNGISTNGKIYRLTFFGMCICNNLQIISFVGIAFVRAYQFSSLYLSISIYVYTEYYIDCGISTTTKPPITSYVVTVVYMCARPSCSCKSLYSPSLCFTLSHSHAWVSVFCAPMYSN